MKYEAVHACELEGDYHAHEWGVINADTGVVCECECEEDATKIADALNRYEALSLGCYHCGSHQCNGEQCTLKEFCVGGAKHRKEIGASNLYRWLRDNEYPDGFQILCMNCQWGKRNCYGGICPHQLKKEQNESN